MKQLYTDVQDILSPILLLCVTLYNNPNKDSSHINLSLIIIDKVMKWLHGLLNKVLNSFVSKLTKLSHLGFCKRLLQTFDSSF